jgi:hypothetical protein
MPDRLRIGVLAWQPEDLHAQRVTYQHALFLALRDHADVVLGEEAYGQIDSFDAVIVFDERGLLIDVAPRLPPAMAPLLVYVTHDYWHHPSTSPST